MLLKSKSYLPVAAGSKVLQAWESAESNRALLQRVAAKYGTFGKNTANKDHKALPTRVILRHKVDLLFGTNKIISKRKTFIKF